MDGRNNSQAPDLVPPPLPQQGDSEENRETVPAQTAWQFCPAERKRSKEDENGSSSRPTALRMDEQAPVKQAPGDRQPSEQMTPAKRKAALDVPSRPKPRRSLAGERRVLRQVIVGLIVTVTILLAVVISLLVVLATDSKNQRESQKPKSVEEPPVPKVEMAASPEIAVTASPEIEVTTSPEIEVTTSPARVVMTQQELLQKEYDAGEQRVRNLLTEIAGTPHGGLLKYGHFQNLEQFVRLQLPFSFFSS